MKSHLPIILLTCFTLLAWCSENRMKNPDFTDGDAHWSIYQGKIDHSVSLDAGSKSLRFDYPEQATYAQALASQTIVLNQNAPVPFFYGVSSCSKGLAEDAIGGYSRYGVELCVNYTDGTKRWIAPRMAFSTGTHAWEAVSDVFIPDKPVKDVIFFCRLRLPGTVWYDGFFLEQCQVLPEPSPCALSQTNTEITLENAYLKLVIEPAVGGTIKSCIIKQGGCQMAGKDLMTGRLLTDRMATRGKCYDRSYTADIVKNTPDEVSVRLTTTAPDGYDYISLSKTVTLSRHSSVLDVSYTYTNLPEAMAETSFAPYFRSAWSVKDRPNTYRVPLSSGVKSFSNANSQNHTYLKDLVAGWMAAEDGTGNGMAVEFDYSRVNQFYMWQGSGLNNSTAEWGFMPVTVPAGKTFSTSLTYYPVTGLVNTEHAENGIASAFSRKTDGSSAIVFTSARPDYLSCRFTAVSADGSETVSVRQLQVAPGMASSLPVETKKLKLLKYELLKDGKPIFEAIHSFDSSYVFTPAVPKQAGAEVKPFELTLSEDFKTPCTNWGRPYVGGRTKALFIANLSLLREVVELAQRMDLEHHTVRMSTNMGLLKWAMYERFGNFNEEDANISLKEKLAQRYDVIVVSSNLWKVIDSKNRSAIIKQLKAGTGLVTINPQNLTDDLFAQAGAKTTADLKAPLDTPVLPHYLTANQPLELLPHTGRTTELAPWMKRLSPVIACGETDGHRSAALLYRCFGTLTPYIPSEMGRPDYRYQDYSLSQVARAILWAAHKEPRSPLGTLAVQDGRIQFQLPGYDHVTARLLTTNTTLGIQRDITLKLTAPFSIPVSLQPGRTICDLILTADDGRHIDWGTCCITTAKPAQITAFTLDNEAVPIGKELTGILEAPADCHAVLTVKDGFGRIIARTDVPAGTAKRSFAIPILDVQTGRMTVTAELSRGDTLADARTVDFLTPHRPAPHHFPFAVGGGQSERGLPFYLRDFMYSQFRSLGITEIRYWNNVQANVYRENAIYGFNLDIPLVNIHFRDFLKNHYDPYAKTKDKKYLCRKPCLNDPEYLKKTKEGLKTDIERLSLFSPTSHDVGDENSLSEWSTPFDFCFSEHTLNALREWLATQYPSLDALNREWGTSFKAWKDVVPQTTDEIRTSARKTRRYAAWADFRRFMELTFCGFFQNVKDACNTYGDSIPLDMSGTQPPCAYTGMDLWLLSKCIDIPAAYDEQNCTEIIRSFGRPLFKPWSGYGATGPGVNWTVWRNAFRFKNYGLSFYTDSSMLYPDYTITPQSRELYEYTKDLRNGLAFLLKDLDDTPEVLIHYSQHSIHAATAEDQYTNFLASRDFWCTLLDDLNIHFRFVSYAELEEDALKQNPARILILPYSFAMSAREAEGIRAFARRGGLVIADRFAGIMNEHCTLQPKGLLDDVFGLTASDFHSASRKELSFGTETTTASLGAAAGANPQCGNSAFFFNPFGNGAALYMNTCFLQYKSIRNVRSKNRGMLEFRTWLLKTIRPFRLKNSVQFQTDETAGTRTFLFRQISDANSARFIGLVREPNAPGKATSVKAELDAPAHIYDLRAGTYLGQMKTLELSVRNADATFVAAMPYTVRTVSLTPAAPAVKAGAAVTVNAAINADAPRLIHHPLRIQVFQPDGTPHLLYSQMVNAPAGRGMFSFRTALNDQTGPWTIQATDIISRQTASTTVLLK